MSQRKFEEIKKANQAVAKKLVEEHFSSSSEEEGDEDLEGKQGKIVANTFITYQSSEMPTEQQMKYNIIKSYDRYNFSTSKQSGTVLYKLKSKSSNLTQLNKLQHKS